MDHLDGLLELLAYLLDYDQCVIVDDHVVGYGAKDDRNPPPDGYFVAFTDQLEAFYTRILAEN